MKYDYNYYVYSYTIGRENLTTQEIEVKSHGTNSWKRIEDPAIWAHFQRNVQKVSEGEANRIYEEFHKKIKNAQAESGPDKRQSSLE